MKTVVDVATWSRLGGNRLDRRRAHERGLVGIPRRISSSVSPVRAASQIYEHRLAVGQAWVLAALRRAHRPKRVATWHVSEDEPAARVPSESSRTPAMPTVSPTPVAPRIDDEPLAGFLPAAPVSPVSSRAWISTDPREACIQEAVGLSDIHLLKAAIDGTDPAAVITHICKAGAPLIACREIAPSGSPRFGHPGASSMSGMCPQPESGHQAQRRVGGSPRVAARRNLEATGVESGQKRPIVIIECRRHDVWRLGHSHRA